MVYNGQKISVGDVVEINDQKRIVTKICNDYFVTDPYDKEIKVNDIAKAINPPESDVTEEVVVKKTRGRGKSK